MISAHDKTIGSATLFKVHSDICGPDAGFCVISFVALKVSPLF